MIRQNVNEPSKLVGVGVRISPKNRPPRPPRRNPWALAVATNNASTIAATAPRASRPLTIPYSTPRQPASRTRVLRPPAEPASTNGHDLHGEGHYRSGRARARSEAARHVHR